MDIEQIIADARIRHYEQISKSLQVIVPMNPNLTANLRAQAELQAEIREDQFHKLEEDLDTALSALKWTKRQADELKLSESHSSAYTAISDALTNVQEAIARLNDAPDQ